MFLCDKFYNCLLEGDRRYCDAINKEVCNATTIMLVNGVGVNSTFAGTTGNMPLPLPDGTSIEEYADVSWSLSQDAQKAGWKQIFETVGVVGALSLAVVIILDDSTIVGVIDNGLLIPLLGYLAEKAPDLYNWFVNAAPQLANCGG